MSGGWWVRRSMTCLFNLHVSGSSGAISGPGDNVLLHSWYKITRDSRLDAWCYDWMEFGLSLLGTRGKECILPVEEGERSKILITKRQTVIVISAAHSPFLLPIQKTILALFCWAGQWESVWTLVQHFQVRTLKCWCEMLLSSLPPCWSDPRSTCEDGASISFPELPDQPTLEK